jgi:hypothetical protein
LLKAIPELKAYVEIGDNLIIVIGTYAIEIAADGKTQLTQKELQKLVESYKN